MKEKTELSIEVFRTRAGKLWNVQWDCWEKRGNMIYDYHGVLSTTEIPRSFIRKYFLPYVSKHADTSWELSTGFTTKAFYNKAHAERFAKELTALRQEALQHD